MDIKKIISSQYFKGATVGIIIAIVTLIVFQLGVSVGYRKAVFGHGLGNSFERNFRDPRRDDLFFMNSPMGIPGGHGAAGEIVSISLPLLVVSGPDKLEMTVVISEDTEIREFQNTLKKEDMKVGDRIVVLGVPNDEGQVEAKLIRLMKNLQAQ